MSIKLEALVGMFDPRQGLLQSIVAILLVLAWLYMLCTPGVDVDPVFLSVLLGVFGYIYGKEVGTKEQQEKFDE